MRKNTTIQILHTSDVHGYIYPTSYTTKLPEDLGLGKLSTLINKLRDDNTLLIDSGDTIQGSPFTYYHSKKHSDKINPIAKIFNEMRYDYVSIGNHEFNYGKDYLLNYLKHLDAKILNSNILDKSTNNPFIGVEHDITEINNFKIGIIGVTTHYIPNWEQPSHIKNLLILDAFETTRNQVKLLRNQVDFLIVNYHGGFERDFANDKLTIVDTGENQGSKMLKEIDGIDLLLTGHQHRLLNGSIHNTIYSQPGYNAQLLSQIVIELSDSQKPLVLTNKLLNLKNVKSNEKVLEIALELEDNCQLFLDTPVGTMDQDLLISNQLEARINKHPLISLINHIQLEYTKADISLCGLGNSVSGFRKEITIRDVIGTYIYPNTLVVKKLSGHVIKQSLEKTAEFFEVINNEITISNNFNTPKLQLYAYDMYDGIEYTIKVSNPKGKRITSLTKDGESLNLNEDYTVAMNNYRSAGGGDYTFIKECEVINDTQKDVIELIIDYILKTKEIVIPHKNNVKVIK